jgi:hypothetical protein
MRSPADRAFRVDVNPEKFRIDAVGVEDDKLVLLNESLDRIRDDIRGVELFASFPLFVSRLRAMDARAGSGDGAPFSDRDLALYFRVAFPDGTPEPEIKTAWEALQDTNLQSIVQRVQLQQGFQPACGADQGYVRAPDLGGGLNVEPVWNLSFVAGNTGDVIKAGVGREVTVCVVDAGYWKDHPNLPGEPQVRYLIDPEEGDASEDHGTRVLGVLVAKPSEDVTGIVPGARIVMSCTMLACPDPPPSGAPNLPLDAKLALCAIDRALDSGVLERGDVLLVELETKDPDDANAPKLPMEHHEDIAECFRQATSLGITVVEPAGNGQTNVDPVVPPQSNGQGESKAIMVGAGTSPSSPPARAPISVTNYGTRVDCQAWGDCIRTLREPTTDKPSQIETNFGYTSGASAIIAGIVAQIQSIHKDAHGVFLDPLVIRDLLREVSLGLAQPTPVTKKIGPQPDLMRILRKLDVFPDVFLRDNLADVGEEPSSSEDIWHSPDIIPRSAPVDGPGSVLGEWCDPDLAQSIVANQDNFVYLRADNRGPFDDKPEFKVYWAYPGTFLQPSTWKSIGSRQARVPGSKSGGTKTILQPITWKKKDLPTDTTHPCLIAVADSEFDAAPALTPSNSPQEYIDFIRKYNNLAHRNVLIAVPASEVALWRFDVRVPSVDLGLPATIKVIPRHPVPGTRLLLGLPEDKGDLVNTQAAAVGLKSLNNSPTDEEDWLSERLADLRSMPAITTDDHSEIDGLNLAWFIGAGDGMAKTGIKLSRIVEMNVVLAAYVPGMEPGSDFEIDVVQEMGGVRVGQVNLRIADQPSG